MRLTITLLSLPLLLSGNADAEVRAAAGTPTALATSDCRPMRHVLERHLLVGDIAERELTVMSHAAAGTYHAALVRCITENGERVSGWLHEVSTVPPAARQRATTAAPDYLYVWATAIDTAPAPPVAPDTVARPRRRGVLLLAVDLRPTSPRRGQVVDAVLVDTAGRSAHHTEHALAPDGMLFANDFGTGTTHIFDLRSAGSPRVAGSFTTAGPFAYPHSFAQLPGGSVLATYQWQGLRQPPGGIAELRRDGTVVRWARAAADGVDSTHIQPYSLEVLPHLDRIVTTSTSMTDDVGVHVQVWRLSDLSLLHTLELPAAPDHPGHDADSHAPHAPPHFEEHHILPGEPRVLEDGRTVMLGTFSCGLYQLTDVETSRPGLRFIHAFPGENCAVPVRIGVWWIQTVPAERALVALNIATPAQPREVSRLTFDAPAAPHWLAADASGRWLVMTSGAIADRFIHLVAFDPATGALSPAAGIPRIDVSRVDVPGLGVVQAVPHGSVFSSTDGR